MPSSNSSTERLTHSVHWCWAQPPRPVAGHRTTAGTAAEAEAEGYSARASCFVVIDHTDFIRPSSLLPVDRPLLLRFARAASSLVFWCVLPWEEASAIRLSHVKFLECLPLSSASLISRAFMKPGFVNGFFTVKPSFINGFTVKPSFRLSFTNDQLHHSKLTQRPKAALGKTTLASLYIHSKYYDIRR